MKYFLLPIFFLLKFSSADAQCFNQNLSYTFGEKISYDVFYNWQFVWVHAGDATFEVKKEVRNGKSLYHFDSRGSSKKSYDWLYKVREKFDAFVDTSDFTPLEFIRKTIEGNYMVNNSYQYNHRKQKLYVHTENSDKGLRLDTLDLPTCTFDVLTSIYYARNIDFNHYIAGDKIPISVIIDGKIHDLYIRYLGKETIETRNEKSYSCIKFKPLLVEGTIFSGGEDMTVWVTDDANRVPVLIEAKILIGAIKAILTEAEGLKYEMTAELTEK